MPSSFCTTLYAGVTSGLERRVLNQDRLNAETGARAGTNEPADSRRLGRVNERLGDGS
jgi:hypothetical protein